MKITIIIPAHNEEEIISKTITNIEEEISSSIDYKITVVNDHSTDNTAAIVKNLTRQYPNLELVDNDTGRGFAAALKKGFSVSKTEFVIPVMADLCDDPKTIIDMYNLSGSGVDIICGSRYMREGRKIGGPLLQSFFSRLVGKSLKYLISIPTSDISNSFKCYRKNFLDRINIQSENFEISMEITLKAYFSGAKITEIPTVWKGRSMGKSKFYLFKVAPAYIKLYLWAILKKISCGYRQTKELSCREKAG